MGKEHELLHAVREGNGQYVRKTLHKYRKSKKHSHKKSFINTPDHEGFAPLHYAALSGDVDMVMAIIEMEGDPNCRDTKGMTPIHLASWGGKDSTVKALLDSDGLPNLSSMSGDTALHLAAQHGYAACIKVLLDYRADASLCNNNMETPLDLACQFGHTSAVRELLTDEKVTFMLITPPANENHKSPLHLSAKCGHDDIAHLLLQAGANVNEETSDGTPLHLAALYGKTNVVRLLLDAGADVNIGNKNGLMALDLVNKFTASRAGLEIKEILRKASGEKVEYAIAVSDYNNQYDDTCLSFRSGDSIAVIEQNENGRWKGYVVNSEHERSGYFPAMAVQLINRSENTSSICSMGSVVSNESSATRDNASTKYEKRIPSVTSPPPQPVGIVPIGNFEVVTLSQNDAEIHAPPPQTASGTIPPRMSSFKQKKQPRFQSPPSQPAPPPQGATPVLQNGATAQRNQSIHPVLKEVFPTSSPPKAPTRSVSIKQSSQSENHTSVTGSSSVQREISQVLQKGFKLNSQDSVKNSRYAELEYGNVPSSPKQNNEDNPTNYSTVYFAEQTDGHGKLYANIPSGSHHVNPTLLKSKSHDESVVRGNKIHGTGTRIHFSTVDQKHNIYENVSKDSPPPQLPIKRSLTLPGSAQYRRQSSETTENVSFSSEGIQSNASVKQRNRAVYENTPVLNEGSLSPGSPRSPNFQFHNGIHDKNGNFQLQSSPRLSKRDHEMLNWLAEMKLNCYYDNFIAHGFDMISIHAITPEDLDIIGVTKTGHRKKLLGEIAKLPFTDQLSNHKPRDVGSWLGQLNLRQYEPNFVEGGFDDIDFIKDLDMNDLEMIDVKKKGHQKKLLLAVQRLNELELTAVLDIAVAESPVKRAASFNNKIRTTEVQEFFPDNPTPMSSCAEQEKADTAKQNPPPPVSSKPKKQPVPVPPKPAKGAPPPAAKPKPRPVSNVSDQESGLIQGSQEEVVKSSKSRDFFKQQEQKAKDEESPTNTIERRTSYSERRNERISPTNTLSHNTMKKSPVPPPATKPRSMSNSSDKGQEKVAPPVAAKKLPPPAPPKRSGSLSENSTVTPAAPVGPSIKELVPEEDLSATELSPRMPSFKPPPPPTADDDTPPPPTAADDAPPLQQSSNANQDLPPPPANLEVSLPPPDASLTEPHSEGNLPPPPPTVELEAPAVPPPAVTVLPIQLPGDKDVEVDDGFAETDDIMADIMADIDDFSKQIDSMF